MADFTAGSATLVMKRFAEKLYRYVVNPPVDEQLTRALDQSHADLPTIWLFGKTGAGKSSIVQRLTGESRAAIGNGFMPCTRQSDYFNYPPEQSIMRFLDTRGLGEAGYDPSQDIESLGTSSHAIMVVMRIRDAEQSPVLSGLEHIRRAGTGIATRQLILVHTGGDELPPGRDKDRAIDNHRRAVKKAWGEELASCVVDFGLNPDGETLADTGQDELEAMLSERIPELQLWLVKRSNRDAERQNFERLRNDVLWYSGTAAAADSLPMVGMVSVPAIQGKMLHSLAGKYDTEWDRRTFAEFTAALGGGAALRYGAGLLGRQMGKMVPVYGQVIGTATAVATTYGSTYALGRAACSYLYYRQQGVTDVAASTKSRYREALLEGIAVGRQRFMKNLS